MDSKPEYVNIIAEFFYVNKNKMTSEKDFYEKFQEYVDENEIVICRKTGSANKKPATRNVACIDMFYAEFNGHVYLLDKKKRVFTANKLNPIEIGYVEEKDNERVLVKYDEYKDMY